MCVIPCPKSAVIVNRCGLVFPRSCSLHLMICFLNVVFHVSSIVHLAWPALLFGDKSFVVYMPCSWRDHRTPVVIQRKLLIIFCLALPFSFLRFPLSFMYCAVSASFERCGELRKIVCVLGMVRSIYLGWTEILFSITNLILKIVVVVFMLH